MDYKIQKEKKAESVLLGKCCLDYESCRQLRLMTPGWAGPGN